MSSKNKNHPRKPDINFVEKNPLVSVIIPVYNSAKFISQTLESLLYQTMKNFEVIAVDDCSTDNSVEVIASFAKKFGGRLHVIKRPKNSGTPGLPRNIGIQFARGKYIAFLDSDDLYTKTALEELSTLAEEYQADVVHLDDTFKVFNGIPMSVDALAFTDINALTNPGNLGFTEWRLPLLLRPQPLSAPTLKPDTLAERINFWVTWRYRLGVCSNFCRRDFLILNQIFFPEMFAAEDQIFNFKCLCLAKNFLRAPNVVYIIRPRADSISRGEKNIQDAEAYFRKWLKVINSGFNELEKFMAQIPFFEKQLSRRYAVLEFFFTCTFNRQIAGKYKKNHASLIYPFLKKEFPSETAALSAYLFNTMNSCWLQIVRLKQENRELKKKLQGTN